MRIDWNDAGTDGWMAGFVDAVAVDEAEESGTGYAQQALSRAVVERACAELGWQVMDVEDEDAACYLVNIRSCDLTELRWRGSIERFASVDGVIVMALIETND